MLFEEMFINGIYVITLEPHEDERGFFMRQFCEDTFKENGLCFHFLQCSISYNLKRGTLRGMHYQDKPYEEVKVVSCLRGAIFDVALDLRQDSNTYGQYVAVELSEHNHKMLYIPKGVAHGFQSLTDNSLLYYQMSENYNQQAERRVSYKDKRFNIKWPIDEKIISRLDKTTDD